MNKREQIERQRQEDAVLNKVLCWIVGAVVLEFFLLLLNRFYVDYKVSEALIAKGFLTALPILTVIFLVLCVVVAVWTVRRRREGKRWDMTAALAAWLLILAGSCAIARIFFRAGVHFLYVAVPVIAVLALIYYLYQREFFAVAVLSVLGILGVWMAPHRVGSPIWVYGYFTVIAVLLVAVVVVSRVLQNGKGTMKIRGKQVELLPKSANYVLLYATCGVVAAVLIAAILVGAMTLLYGILVAWLLIMAVYYTVRLM